MSVDIDPLELNFRRPFTQEVSQTLTIKNPNPHPVAFKVKTTAPKQYCVRPNAGRIEPGQDFDVTVLLQAMKAEPAPDAKCRDKFLVQVAPITGDKEFASVSSVLETTEKSAVSERKIRVNWLAASSDDANGAVPAVVRTPNKQTALNGTSTDTPDARTFSSPEASRDTSTPPSTAPPPYTDNVKQDSVLSEKVETAKSVVSDAASAVTATAASIKNKAEQELRPRNVSSGATTTTQKKPAPQLAQAASPAVQGVPVKITALLCFLAFLIAYFFF